MKSKIASDFCDQTGELLQQEISGIPSLGTWNELRVGRLAISAMAARLGLSVPSRNPGPRES